MPGREPGSGAWLRRNPTGGWMLSIKQHHVGEVRACASLVDAARVIAADTQVQHVYVWSEPRCGFVQLELNALVPLLEESATAS